MARHHIRRKDRAIEGKEELMQVLRSGAHMTLALSKDDEPYLVTVNYSLDESRDSVYFHCAPQGKKIDILKANPRVWGQVLEDHGYIQGECDHAYTTVQFNGRVEFVSGIDEKKRALELMIDRLENAPEAMKKESLAKDKLQAVCICRLSIEGLSGKRNVVR